MQVSTKETIQKYFEAIHKGGWESYVADDFVFVNSNFDQVARSKTAYVEGARRFFRATTAAEIKQLIVEGNTACAAVRYRLRSPKGNTGVCDVAEILAVKDGKITSSSIFFDTKAFQDFMARG
ncbi:MAG: nuclear transport factor 2 family protein [Terriglobales bacterium]